MAPQRVESVVSILGIPGAGIAAAAGAAAVRSVAAGAAASAVLVRAQLVNSSQTRTLGVRLCHGEARKDRHAQQKEE